MTTPVVDAVITRSEREEVLRTVDPHDFVALDGPTFEPCSACRTKPSFYQEKWRKGMTERRRLCKGCYGAAVRREQAAVEPLLRTIAPGTMERVTASVGRCDVYGLEKAAWTGGVRLCETCYQRESRRRERPRRIPLRYRRTPFDRRALPGPRSPASAP